MLRLATLWLPRSRVLSTKATLISRGFATVSRHERNKTNVLTRQLQQQLQSKDVILYEAPPSAQRTFLFMYISAGVQLLFWGNLASLAYVSYGTKETQAENSPYVLAPKSKRIGIASALCAVGVGISAAMCLYPWRYINRLWLLKGGSIARFETCAKGIASHKVREFPVSNLNISQRVFTGVGPKGTDAINSSSSHIFLRPTRARMGYILDRKGQFRDPKLFDGIFHR
ncbi:hypothetical protein VKS41_002133 [Umbelopsis sp. WA50703]